MAGPDGMLPVYGRFSRKEKITFTSTDDQNAKFVRHVTKSMASDGGDKESIADSGAACSEEEDEQKRSCRLRHVSNQEIIRFFDQGGLVRVNITNISPIPLSRAKQDSVII